MARLAVDGTKSIYFEDLGGAGRALIMVHGWGMDNRCWDGVILPLLAAGHRVITMDHRGCGRVQFGESRRITLRSPSP